MAVQPSVVLYLMNTVVLSPALRAEGKDTVNAEPMTSCFSPSAYCLSLHLAKSTPIKQGTYLSSLALDFNRMDLQSSCVEARSQRSVDAIQGPQTRYVHDLPDTILPRLQSMFDRARDEFRVEIDRPLKVEVRRRDLVEVRLGGVVV